MEENIQLKLEERIKKILSVVTEDFGREDVSFLMNMEYPFILEITEESDSLDSDEKTVTKIEIEDVDNLEKQFKALPSDCEVKIVGIASTMILQCKEFE